MQDSIGMADELKSLMKDLKFLVEDSKQAAINVKKGEEALHTAKTELNDVLKVRKLLVKNGTLEPIREKEAALTLDAMDTQAMLLQAEQALKTVNPLEPIVNKFAEMGYDPEGAFDMLDDNGDGVLTVNEIQDGMKHHRIHLAKDEWDAFLKALDANSDGVLDLDEWVSILTPQVEQQTEMYKLMGGVNITDPLVLEERVLDLQYRNRHLEKELKVMRAQNSDDGGAKKKKIKEISKKILQLEQEDELARQRKKEAEKNVESDLQKAFLAKDKVQQDLVKLEREKGQCTAEYAMRLEQIQQNLRMLEKKHDDVRQYILEMKKEREEVKTKLFRGQVKFANCQKQEVNLDKQIEEILGRAVTSKDLM